MAINPFQSYIEERKKDVEDFDYEAEQKKYADRLQQFSPPPDRYNFFDLATDISRGLTAQQQTDRPNSLAGGLALGFGEASQSMRKNDADYAKARREVGLEAARIAMQDEQEAVKYLDQAEKFAAEQFLKNQGSSDDTSLITNVKFIQTLYTERDKHPVGSKPYNEIDIAIRAAEAGIGAYKYDTNRLAEIKEAETAASQGRIGLTVLTAGQINSDKEFGTWYTKEWLVKGGGSTEGTYIESLAGVRNVLAEAEKTGESITSVGQGILSKYPILQAYFNEEGAIAQDRVAGVAQLSLKAILGGQFSEREGELLIQRAFNPSLPEAENIERLTQLINRIQMAESYKKQITAHWEKNGTLDGFSAPKYVEEDFRSDIQNFYRQDIKLMSNEELENEYLTVPEDSIYFKVLEEQVKARQNTQ
tara:strand:+ start:43 stop:1299 length:1257 start_codon:yes stop_codon:yes gene_type:complete